MKTVLIVGAGKSSASLIDYMLKHAKNRWRVIVMDANPESIFDKLNSHPSGEAAVVALHEEEKRQSLVQRSDIVLSLMPPHLHILLAHDCLKFKKHLITPSYRSEELQALDPEVRGAGLLFMCEMGADPGIDHMSAMSLINGIHRIAGKINTFRSAAGGLVAPESDDNPWHYKFNWNPRNVVLAGQGGASWLEDGKKHQRSYQTLFASAQEISVPGLHGLKAYPNRDSFPYIDLYGVPEAQTFVRSTIRYADFLVGWHIVANIGLADDTDRYNADETTFADWIAQKAGVANDKDLRKNFQSKWNLDSQAMKLFEWLNVFENRPISARGFVSSAAILQSLLEERWKMRPTDRDMVVLQHEIEYERRGVSVRLRSSMVVKGQEGGFSAMSQTVGLPMALLARKLLLNEGTASRLNGVRIPVMPEVYVPILRELQNYGIEFVEEIF